MYRVSSVGRYINSMTGKLDTLGAAPDSFFETMVFRTTAQPVDNSEGCGCLSFEDWSELEQVRYATEEAAQSGHEAMVLKYQEEPQP